MMLEATALGAEVVVVLLLIGLGPSLVALRFSGIGLLLTPIVGLAILAVAIQLLTPLLPSWITVLVVTLVFGAFSAVVIWRTRVAVLPVAHAPSLSAQAGRGRAWIDIAIVSAFALGLYHALLGYLYSARFFTLAGWPADNMEFYVPAGQYLRAHGFDPLHPLALVDNPTTLYMSHSASEFPNSVGPLDGAFSVLSRLQVHQVFDPLNAVLYALLIPATYVLVARLGGGRTTRIAAVLLLGLNQLVFWVMGLGFQQEIEAMPLFIGALALLLIALDGRQPAVGVLAGFTAGAILGIYLPIFVLFLICALGYVATLLIGRFVNGGFSQTLTQVGLLAAGGLLGSATAIYWLLRGPGLRFWLTVFGQKYAAGGIGQFFPLKFLLGLAPLPAVWWPSLPALWWGSAWSNVSHLLALVVLVLVLAGGVVLATRRNFPALGLVALPGAYLLYLRFIERYPYGFTKTLSYLIPLSSALVAFGAVELVGAIRQTRGIDRELPRQPASVPWQVASTVLAAALVPVLISQAMSSFDTERLWSQAGPTFPSSFQALATLPRQIPTRAWVLVVNPGSTYADEIKTSAVRYYLVEDNLEVHTRLVGQSDLKTRFDYLVAPPTVDAGPDYRQVWEAPALSLVLYRRQPGS